MRLVAVLWIYGLVLSWCPKLSADSLQPTIEHEARRLLSLVDYIGGDYGAAVESGAVVNAAEYQEMQDFAGAAQSELRKLEAQLAPAAMQSLSEATTKLTQAVQAKAELSLVRRLTGRIKKELLSALPITTAPGVRPDLALARASYAAHCASCHGAQGRGDGPGAAHLEPPARNFHEENLIVAGSPLKYFNTQLLGVEGTSMAAFDKVLSETERWSLSYFIAGLRHSGGADSTLDPQALWANLPPPLAQALLDAGLSLELLSQSSDEELSRWLLGPSASVPHSLGSEEVLRVLRLAAPYVEALPIPSVVAATSSSEAGKAPAIGPLAGIKLAQQKLGEARALMAQGQGQKAEEQLLDAYLMGFEKAERALGLKRMSLVKEAEAAFLAARHAAQQNDLAAFQPLAGQLENILDQASIHFATGAAEASGQMGNFWAALIIILREGMEAFLIIAALLAMLTKMGATELRRWVHGGWLCAIAAGGLTFVLFGTVINLTGAHRELVEAVSTGLAALLLFHVSFWLLNQAERQKWQAYISAAARQALATKQVATIFFLSFIAVYREAVETALFYQALLSSSPSVLPVWLGFAIGALVLLITCSLLLRYGLRIPLRQFFLSTSLVMVVLAIILAGKSVHELIEAGVVKPSQIVGVPTIDILGIYPYWESLLLQGFAVGFALALLWLSSRHKSGHAPNSAG